MSMLFSSLYLEILESRLPTLQPQKLLSIYLNFWFHMAKSHSLLGVGGKEGIIRVQPGQGSAMPAHHPSLPLLGTACFTLMGMQAWSSSRSFRQISRCSSPAPAMMCSPDSSMMHWKRPYVNPRIEPKELLRKPKKLGVENGRLQASLLVGSF